MYDIFEGPSNHTVICRLWEESRFIYFISTDIKMPRADSETYRLWYREWYERNREKLIEAARKRRLNDPDASKTYNREYYQLHKDKIQEYNRLKKREYYQKRGDVLRERDREAKLKKRAERREAREKAKASPDARKLPREYLPTSEPQPCGMPFAFPQRKKLLETCPSGFLEEQPKENPFHMTFL